MQANMINFCHIFNKSGIGGGQKERRLAFSKTKRHKDIINFKQAIL